MKWLKRYRNDQLIQKTFAELATIPKRLLHEPKPIYILQDFLLGIYGVEPSREHNAFSSARLELIDEIAHDMRKLPPTLRALVEHVKRAIYICNLYWGDSLNTVMKPSKEKMSISGWDQNGGFKWSSEPFDNDKEVIKELFRSCRCRQSTDPARRCRTCKCETCWKKCGCRGQCHKKVRRSVIFLWLFY